MENQINNQADEIFTSNWNVYKKIIAHNYMFHNELAAEVHRIIQSQPHPLTVLDLGCGDAALFSQLLAQYNVEQYVGYDTSAEVLRYAAASLQPMPYVHRLVNDYLQRSTARETQTFNCIYSSFAIHHLQDEEKLKFFKEVYDSLLAADGVFIYIDVLRNDNEQRNDYLDNYMQNIAANWTALTPAEFTLVEDHIRAYDFPIEKTQLKRALAEIGYTIEEPVLLDKAHSMLVLRK